MSYVYDVLDSSSLDDESAISIGHRFNERLRIKSLPQGKDTVDEADRI